MRLTLPAPRGFSLRHTVLSHGWYALPPFRAASAGDALEGVLAVGQGRAIRYRLSWCKGHIVVESDERADPSLRKRLRAAVGQVLNLDLDLSAFHGAARRSEALGWIADEGVGRLLRAPSAWEDLVKLILTTNCSWGATTRMVTALVERYGARAADGSAAFPGPEAVAAAGPDALREHVRAGYRAPLLARLADDVAAGRIDLDRWQSDLRPAAELRREMMELPGVGPYVAENLLKMMGRPSGLALDSWLRVQYARVYHGGRRVTDRTIGRRYARFGDWAGLALWCDMTREWIEGDEPPQLALEPTRARGKVG